jgi:enoyl-CoA hydratase
MNYENILYEKNSHIVSITLNRPKRLNAINPPTQVELWHALNYFQNDKDAWVCILSGSGDRAFCAGADLKLYLQYENFSHIKYFRNSFITSSFT